MRIIVPATRRHRQSNGVVLLCRACSQSTRNLGAFYASGDKMKRIHVPGVVDVVTSDDQSEIESLAANPKLDRAYADRSIPANAAFLDQLLGVLEVNGKRFPTVSPRGDSARAAAQ